MLRELLATHPGLEFLQSTPEFQDRYGILPQSIASIFSVILFAFLDISVGHIVSF